MYDLISMFSAIVTIQTDGGKALQSLQKLRYLCKNIYITYRTLICFCHKHIIYDIKSFVIASLSGSKKHPLSDFTY